MTINKKKSHAFGKDIYLMGIDSYGDKFWLEHPSWDCKWYWGFGYLETYTNNSNPSKARDINMHTHWNYYVDKNGSGELLSTVLEQTPFTIEEEEKLSTLFIQFYSLRKLADNRHREINVVDDQREQPTYEHLVGVELPKVMNEILTIVSSQPKQLKLVTNPIKKDLQV